MAQKWSQGIYWNIQKVSGKQLYFQHNYHYFLSCEYINYCNYYYIQYLENLEIQYLENLGLAKATASYALV